jgi:hypothetical protein
MITRGGQLAKLAAALGPFCLLAVVAAAFVGACDSGTYTVELTLTGLSIVGSQVQPPTGADGKHDKYHPYELRVLLPKTKGNTYGVPEHHALLACNARDVVPPLPSGFSYVPGPSGDELVEGDLTDTEVSLELPAAAQQGLQMDWASAPGMEPGSNGEESQSDWINPLQEMFPQMDRPNEKEAAFGLDPGQVTSTIHLQHGRFEAGIFPRNSHNQRVRWEYREQGKMGGHVQALAGHATLTLRDLPRSSPLGIVVVRNGTATHLNLQARAAGQTIVWMSITNLPAQDIEPSPELKHIVHLLESITRQAGHREDVPTAQNPDMMMIDGKRVMTFLIPPPKGDSGGIGGVTTSNSFCPPTRYTN